jgi:hypothetical protein
MGNRVKRNKVIRKKFVIRHSSFVFHKKLFVQLVNKIPGPDRIYSPLIIKIMSTTDELTKNYSGIFGNMMVARNRKGKTILTIPPTKPKRVPTEKMVNARRQFKLAANYAKTVLQDPVKLAAYAAKAHDYLTPYVLALTDYLKPPVVTQVDASRYLGQAGDKISVTAFDDFALTDVSVKVADATGALIEEGVAVFNLTNGNHDFTATVAVPDLAGVVITATATDNPGHPTELSITL